MHSHLDASAMIVFGQRLSSITTEDKWYTQDVHTYIDSFIHAYNYRYFIKSGKKDPLGTNLAGF